MSTSVGSLGFEVVVNHVPSLFEHVINRFFWVMNLLFVVLNSAKGCLEALFVVQFLGVD